MPDPLDVAHDVAGVAPLGYQPERHSLAAAADPERRMWFLNALGLVYGRVVRIVLALKTRVVLGLQAVVELGRLAEHPQPFANVGEAITISPPRVLLPTRPEARRQPA